VFGVGDVGGHRWQNVAVSDKPSEQDPKPPDPPAPKFKKKPMFGLKPARNVSAHRKMGQQQQQQRGKGERT
jgi:hypothetical protein